MSLWDVHLRVLSFNETDAQFLLGYQVETRRKVDITIRTELMPVDATPDATALSESWFSSEKKSKEITVGFELNCLSKGSSMTVSFCVCVFSSPHNCRMSTARSSVPKLFLVLKKSPAPHSIAQVFARRNSLRSFFRCILARVAFQVLLAQHLIGHCAVEQTLVEGKRALVCAGSFTAMRLQ